MTPEKFVGLLAGYTNLQPFSQSEFRKNNLPQITHPLCSGLVDGWLRSMQQGGDFFNSVSAPDDQLLRYLVGRQANNYYPLLPIDESIQLSSNDSALLKKKYQVKDVGRLIAEMKRAGAKDMLSFDLMKFFEVENASISGFERVDGSFFKEILPEQRSSQTIIQLFIVRYLSGKGPAELKKSHRMAVYRDDSGWHFFDPNSGYIHFSSVYSARLWFGRFWKTSSYSTRKPVPGVDLLSVYTLF
ncbi:MAG TPA: YopT-type cysteine protease domain-containing protein [Mucilaginibacter sp.]|nr:YopT-type cysteine protease domain-containing protein [Mucilaginibacter sp.]